MKTFFYKIIFFTFIAFSTQVFSQEQLYPKTTDNGKEFYIYQVSQGEGLYSISKKFGVTQNELHQYNPEIAKGLKFGVTLKIPAKKQVFLPKQHDYTIDGNYKIHIVERSQTLYSISKTYNIAIESILSINPSAKNGIKVGDELKIPTTASNNSNKAPITNSGIDTVFILHEVKKKETLYSISKKYDVDINSILELNDIKGFPKKGDILRICKKRDSKKSPSSNDSINTTEPINPLAQNNNTKDSLSTALQVAILLPFKLEMAGADKNADKFIDFYRGILLAVDKAKKQGISSLLYVYDTGASEERIDSLLKKEDLKNVDLIIGPAYTNQIQKVTDFAKLHQIYTVIPFSQKVKDIDTNPYIIQFNSPQQTQINITKNKLIAKIQNKPIVLAYFDNNQDEGNSFANALLAECLVNNKPHSRHFITEQNADSICQLAINQNAVLLLASSNQERVKPILRIINRHRLGTNLELIGFDNWGLSLLNESRPIYFSSLFNPNSISSRKYKEEYEKYFGIANNAYPNFDQLGYDLMCNMIEMLKNKNTDKIHFPSLNNVQSDMDFRKNTSDGGWINQHIYLIHLE